MTILSEEGKVVLEGMDTNVKGTLKLDGKDGIVSKGVMDTYDNKTTNKNHSASVGVFVGFNGDSYGIGIEASASVGKGKENSHSEMWQNNQLQAGKLVTYSDNGKLTLDATNVKADRWEGDVQGLELISRQDVTKYDSKQVQAGGSVSVTYGSGGGANVNASYNAAKLNTAQVENQTSVDIGNGGMEVKVRGNTHLEGATISSQADKANNRFQTGSLTTSDIQNHSELKTESVAISGGSGGINPLSALSLLGNKNESSQSTTKAAIGENIDITLTDDPNAETTLKNLNRDTQNANQKVTKHDLTEVRETQELVKGIGEIADKAMQIYTHNEREKIEQAKLELGKAKAQKASEQEIGKLTEELNRLQADYDKEYGTGSKTKQAVDAVTAVLQGLATKDLGQAAVGLASPYLNEQIKQHTTNADGSINTEANLLAHALLGAVEAQLTGNNALAGAVAGAGGEAAAMVITNTLYPNKTNDQLTEAEKKNITFLSQLAGGLASGVVGDSTQSAAIGADIAKRAVENNNFGTKIVKEIYPGVRKAICTQKCLEALSGLGIGAAIVLSKDEITDAIKAASSNDPTQIAKLTDLQRQYLNEEIISGKGSLFIGNQVWIPNTSGGFTAIDPDLVVTTYGGKQIIDPRIIINDTGGIQYPADYDLPNHTGGNISNNLLDKKDSILIGGQIEVGHWSDNVLEARNKDTVEPANKLGYKQRIPPQKAPFNSHGQPVYWNGKNYITPDIDSHNVSDGWKMFDRKGNRLGTYDKDLNRIKD
ncbi:hemagglutinin repeat-containing protein [Ursidibacter arcticus]